MREDDAGGDAGREMWPSDMLTGSSGDRRSNRKDAAVECGRAAAGGVALVGRLALGGYAMTLPPMRRGLALLARPLHSVMR